MFAHSKGVAEKSRRRIPGDSRTFPDRVLKPFAQAFETLRETNCPRLPVGIGQHEVMRLNRWVKKNAYRVCFIFKIMELGRIFRIRTPKYPYAMARYRSLL